MLGRLLGIVVTCALSVAVQFAGSACGAALAETGATHATPAAELMDKLVGRWVLTGDIAGENVVHDVDAAWVLQGRYVRISEVAREHDEQGRPRYEATIFVGWQENAHHYVCIWLDNTGVATGDVTCTASVAPDSLPLQFRDAHGALMIATTFSYNRADDTWRWRIDNIENGRVVHFANLVLQRR